MKPLTSFQRKVGYLIAIVVLLFCLYWLGAPAITRNGQVSPGGWLAQYRRAEVGLNQAQLGQIDPTGTALKLSTFGLRGVAANVLWGKAQNYKMRKDWVNLRATVNQITKLQPHFVSVWIFQAWNQSYNISVEFEEVRQRYRWVIQGVEFLQKGTKYNGREPRLPWETGWILSNKIGRADEHRQFRKLFVEDDDFHRLPGGGSRPLIERDNWLVGAEWFAKAEELADTLGVQMKGKGPLVYRSNAPMRLMSYAEALEKEGIFGERARVAWQSALDAWIEYGKKDIPTSRGQMIQLNDKEEEDARADALAAEIDQIQVGDRAGKDIREEIRQQKIADLPDDQREALAIPTEERTAEQHFIALTAEKMIEVTAMEVALEITGPNRPEAMKKSREALVHRLKARGISQQRQHVNFEYWRLRAQMERLEDVATARELIYDANRVFEDKGDLAAAIDLYEKAFVKWRDILDRDQFQPMIGDTIFTEDMTEVVRRYAHILELDDREFPKKFILQDVVDLRVFGN